MKAFRVAHGIYYYAEGGKALRSDRKLTEFVNSSVTATHQQLAMMSLQNTDYWPTPPLSALNAQLIEKIASWSELDTCPVCRSHSLKKNFSTIRHILRRKHVDAYLNEFVFRYNRRFHRHVSFETVLGLAAHRGPKTYRDVVNRGADSPSGASERSTTYRSP